MRIVLLSKQPPFAADKIATGNQLRMRQLQRALQSAGHETRLFWHNPGRLPRPSAEDAFDNPGQLSTLLTENQPDAVIVGYWDILEWLPEHPAWPVVLDFLAPRPLELLYQHPAQVHGDLPRLFQAMAKADRVMVGHRRQADLLHGWLLSAGFDLRDDAVLIVPPRWTIDKPQTDTPLPQPPLCLASGGVNWPWRDDAAFWQALEQSQTPFSPLRFGGDYPGERRKPDRAQTTSDTSSLTSYQAYTRALQSRADIGVDVGGADIERRYAMSFRLQDYLGAGLPVIVDARIPLADTIVARGAGWAVRSPAEFTECVANLNQNPQTVAAASQAVADWNVASPPEKAVAPLLDYLGKPDRREPLPGFVQVSKKLPLKSRWRRRARLLVRGLMQRLQPPQPGEAVVLISRSDLFPPNHGAAVKVIETGKAIAANGRKCFLLTHDRKTYWQFKADSWIEHRFPWWLRMLGAPKRWMQLAHAGRNLPEADGFLYLPLSDHHMILRTAWLARRHDIGVFQAEFPAYARPALWGRSLTGGTAVIVQHNVEYRRIQQQQPGLDEGTLRYLKAMEVQFCNQVDTVICVSENDRQILTEAGVDAEKLTVIPHGVNLEAYQSAVAIDLRSELNLSADTRVVIFHGTYRYPPNRRALQMFADELLPRWREVGLNIKVVAIGRNAPSQPPDDDIILTGSVKNLPAWLKAGDVAVVPLTDGGGTRMKIIEYFAAGVPVVSTSKGIEGIPADNERHALITDDWDQLADSVAHLLTDSAVRSRLVDGGTELAQTLDWKSLARRYLQTYRNC